MQLLSLLCHRDTEAQRFLAGVYSNPVNLKRAGEGFEFSCCIVNNLTSKFNYDNKQYTCKTLLKSLCVSVPRWQVFYLNPNALGLLRFFSTSIGVRSLIKSISGARIFTYRSKYNICLMRRPNS